MISGLARDIKSLSTGSLAQMKRNPAQGSGSPALWRLVAQYDGIDSIAMVEDNQYYEKWATILQGIALMTRQSHDKTAHTYSGYIGRVLAETNCSETRLARVLGSKGPTRTRLCQIICRFLVNKDITSINWEQMKSLIMEDDPGIEKTIARDYYSTMHTSAELQSGSGGK